MKAALLTRLETGDEGTFGELVAGDYKCSTLELPWRDNAKGKSCIPEGTYHFQWAKSPKHGECYEADPDNEAPNRADIQIHSANLAGDTSKGYVAQLEGCIALGRTKIKFRGGAKPAGSKDQHGIAASKAEMAAFHNLLKKQPFVLQICWAPGVAPKETP